MTVIPLSRLLIEGRSRDHPVAIQHGRTIGFDRFRADIARAAASFTCRRAALACQDSYNFAVGFYGLLHAGAEIAFPPNNQPGTLQSLKDGFDLVVDDAAIENGYNDAPASLQPIGPLRQSLFFYTSGTTGTPKAIPKNLAALECEVATLDNLWGGRERCGFVFSTVSHQHVYGLTFKLLWPLMSGLPFVAETHSLWEALLAELTPNAIIVSSPAHLERLDGIEPLLPQERPELIFSAGAPLSFDASRHAGVIFGCRPTEIFGSTETGAFATRQQASDDEPWRLLPGISMRSDDDGRLSLRSPFVGPDWLTTADLVKPTADGFRFLGRADRVTKIEGKRISLAEVEQALIRLPAVKSAVAVVLQGKPNRLAAAVVLSDEGRSALEKMGGFRFGRFLRTKLNTTQEAAGIPRLWRFVDELPSQELGKCRDADILSLFEDAA